MIICVCNRGNVRSITLANILKDVYGEEAIAIGLDTFSAETIIELFELDHEFIFVGDNSRINELQTILGSSDFDSIDIEYDKWMMPMHPDLVEFLLSKLDEPNGAGSYPNKATYLNAHKAAWERVTK